jgi:hypothetical protein
MLRKSYYTVLFINDLNIYNIHKKIFNVHNDGNVQNELYNKIINILPIKY